MSEWISVDDKLPDDNQLVVAFWRNEDGDWQVDFDAIDEDMWAEWFNRAEYLNIAGANCNEEAPYTHWMPLPEPPK